jgi:hypothetical protein
VSIDEAQQKFVVERDWHRPGETSHARRYPLSPWTMPWLDDGRTWVMPSRAADPRRPPGGRLLRQPAPAPRVDADRGGPGRGDRGAHLGCGRARQGEAGAAMLGYRADEVVGKRSHA